MEAKTTDAPEIRTGPSKKQQFAAVAAATAVTVVLSIGANYLIDKVANRVQKTITPDPKTEN